MRCFKGMELDLPLADILFLHIAWKYKPLHPIADHSLWPCPLQVVSNFVRHSYVWVLVDKGAQCLPHAQSIVKIC